MGSGTSRGAPEWSGGKDLYMESCFRGSGKSSVFSGIVPGSFQKVPEVPEGSGFHGGFHLSRRPHGL